jgi:hypothetical protein
MLKLTLREPTDWLPRMGGSGATKDDGAPRQSPQVPAGASSRLNQAVDSK